METCVLFRYEDHDTEEFEVCSKYFKTYRYRSEVPPNSLVIGRYSALPFYKELEAELKLNGSALINTWYDHNYIADIRNWYPDVAKFTPTTYSNWSNLPEDKQWVVKGITNSRKHQWATHMFAPDKKSLREVISNLLGDTFIGSQGLVVREYVPLKKIGEDMNGLPVTLEYRLFFFGSTLLASGFYWSEHEDLHEGKLLFEGERFAKFIASIVAKHTNFFVLDIALTEAGNWILIEINDGQMSGLSCVDPEELYSMLELKLEALTMKGF